MGGGCGCGCGCGGHVGDAPGGQARVAGEAREPAWEERDGAGAGAEGLGDDGLVLDGVERARAVCVSV